MAEMDWLMDEIAPKDRMQNLNSMALIVRSNGDLSALVPALRMQCTKSIRLSRSRRRKP